LLFGVIITRDDAIVSHPAFLGGNQAALDQDGITSRHQLLYKVNITAVAHHTGKFCLRIDVIEHFVGHHVAVFTARLEHCCCDCLVTFPTPVGKQHG